MGSEPNPEPSMEEILASIKRVIADDNRAPGGQRGLRSRAAQPEPPPPPEAEPEEAEEDVLELDEPIRDDEGLISADRAAASRQSLAQLAALRAQGEPEGPVDQAPLEAVVRDMLRPLLKQWLEERLPDMVEEMVAREIARITGKKL
jgi:hypothetical protein